MIEYHISRSAGHPGDSTRAGFDLLEYRVDTVAEKVDFLKRARDKFWKVWVDGFDMNEGVWTGRYAGALYKPSGWMEPWTDSEDHPHPGGVVSGDAPQRAPEVLFLRLSPVPSPPLSFAAP